MPTLRNCDRCGSFPECSGDDVKPHTCPHNRPCRVDGCDKCAAIVWPVLTTCVRRSKAGERAVRRAREAARRELRRRLGQCVGCARKVEGSKYCADCQERKAESVDELRREREAAGLCIDCGRMPNTEGRYCEGCHGKRLGR